MKRGNWRRTIQKHAWSWLHSVASIIGLKKFEEMCFMELIESMAFCLKTYGRGPETPPKGKGKSVEGNPACSDMFQAFVLKGALGCSKTGPSSTSKLKNLNHLKSPS